MRWRFPPEAVHTTTTTTTKNHSPYRPPTHRPRHNRKQTHRVVRFPVCEHCACLWHKQVLSEPLTSTMVSYDPVMIICSSLALCVFSCILLPSIAMHVQLRGEHPVKERGLWWPMAFTFVQAASFVMLMLIIFVQGLDCILYHAFNFFFVLSAATLMMYKAVWLLFGYEISSKVQEAQNLHEEALVQQARELPTIDLTGTKRHHVPNMQAASRSTSTSSKERWDRSTYETPKTPSKPQELKIQGNDDTPSLELATSKAGRQRASLEHFQSSLEGTMDRPKAQSLSSNGRLRASLSTDLSIDPGSPSDKKFIKRPVLSPSYRKAFRRASAPVVIPSDSAVSESVEISSVHQDKTSTPSRRSISCASEQRNSTSRSQTRSRTGSRNSTSRNQTRSRTGSRNSTSRNQTRSRTGSGNSEQRSSISRAGSGNSEQRSSISRAGHVRSRTGSGNHRRVSRSRKTSMKKVMPSSANEEEDDLSNFAAQSQSQQSPLQAHKHSRRVSIHVKRQSSTLISPHPPSSITAPCHHSSQSPDSDVGSPSSISPHQTPTSQNRNRKHLSKSHSYGTRAFFLFFSFFFFWFLSLCLSFFLFYLCIFCLCLSFLLAYFLFLFFLSMILSLSLFSFSFASDMPTLSRCVRFLIPLPNIH